VNNRLASTFKVALSTLAFGSIALPQESAFAFNIGPYQLGMTNKAAKKFGLDWCGVYSGNSKLIECGVESTLVSVENLQEARLFFWRGTSTLQSIKVVLEYQSESDYRANGVTGLERAYSQLRMKKCSVTSSGSYSRDIGWCYNPPSFTRLISVDRMGEFVARATRKRMVWVNIRAAIDPKHFTSFKKRQREAERVSRDVSRIQQGK
jgi:hypothetical protein